MSNINDELAGEKKTISIMVHVYCRRNHQHGRKELCDDCRELLDYACQRLEKCKFGIKKPVCSKCTVHCYRPEMRERIREVMRYAGPRIALKHPVIGLSHLFRSLRRENR